MSGPLIFAAKQLDQSHMQGRHNERPESQERMLRSNTYKDLSTVWITPTRDHRLDDQVVFQSWMGILKAPNQKFCQLCIGGAEVGDAYNAGVEMILRDTVKWKYMLTVEVDNLPPRDGILKLYESTDKYDAIGGLYWTKEENGHPMIYGDPSDADDPDNFRPQPVRGDIQPCNGLGMGFTLFSVDMFRKMPKPWFQSSPDHTQDLFFFANAKRAGYKFASDNRVKVGHIDFATRIIW